MMVNSRNFLLKNHLTILWKCHLQCKRRLFIVTSLKEIFPKQTWFSFFKLRKISLFKVFQTFFVQQKYKYFFQSGQKKSPYHRSKIKFTKEFMWFYHLKILLEILFYDQITFTRTYLHLIHFVHVLMTFFTIFQERKCFNYFEK